MSQVPRYMVIGNGRLARHMLHYLRLLNLGRCHWHRHLALSDLSQLLPQCRHVLLLIRDDAITTFAQTHLQDFSGTIIHCSGSLVTDAAYGAHPLMAFGQQFYNLAHYQSIPFIVDEGAPAFAQLFPGLSNPEARITPALKARYHALCVLSGNFSCMLWQKFFSELEGFGWPHDIGRPYLQQQTLNIAQNYQTALTGPLVRQDLKTIRRNLQALEDDPFQAVYQSFVECYYRLQKDKTP